MSAGTPFCIVCMRVRAPQPAKDGVLNQNGCLTHIGTPRCQTWHPKTPTSNIEQCACLGESLRTAVASASMNLHADRACNHNLDVC